MAEPGLHLTFVEGPRADESVAVQGERFSIGRAADSDLELDDDEVSRRHAEIRRTSEGEFEIADQGSRNGVTVNANRITEPTVLRAGDQVRIGDTVLKVGGAGAETRFGGGETEIAGQRGAGETQLAPSGRATLTGVSGPGSGKRVHLTSKPTVVGRDESCDFTLDDEEVSRRHTELRVLESGTVEVRDLGSRNGTWVNGSRISAPTEVHSGDTVDIGETSFGVEGAGRAPDTVRASPAPAAEPTPPFQPARSASPSAVQRLALQKKVGRATAVAIVAALAAIAVVVLAVAGVFSGSDGEPSGADVVDDVRPSTVLVNVQGPDGRVLGNGSGWVYDAEEGLIVTNAHVVNAGTRFQVGVGSEVRRANVVGVSTCDDLALLRTNDVTDLETLELGSQQEIRQGDRVFVIGYPLNASLESEANQTTGTVSVVKTRPDLTGAVDPNALPFPNVIQMDATINGGNSGGPAVNDKRELVGVNTFTAGVEDQNYAIGVDQVRKVIPKLATGDSIGYAGFGVTALASVFASDPEELAARIGGWRAFLGLSKQQQEDLVSNSLVIDNVLPNFSGDQAGLIPDLLITSVGGIPTGTRQDYCNAVENVDSGETVPIEVFDPVSGQAAKVPITFE